MHPSHLASHPPPRQGRAWHTSPGQHPHVCFRATSTAAHLLHRGKLPTPHAGDRGEIGKGGRPDTPPYSRNDTQVSPNHNPKNLSKKKKSSGPLETRRRTRRTAPPTACEGTHHFSGVLIANGDVRVLHRHRLLHKLALGLESRLLLLRSVGIRRRRWACAGLRGGLLSGGLGLAHRAKHDGRAARLDSLAGASAQTDLRGCEKQGEHTSCRE